GLVHILQAEVIGFGFVGARELQERQRNREVHALIDRIASPAVGNENHGWNRRELYESALRFLARAVAGADVGDFMGHHAGKLRLLVRVQDEAAVYVKKSAWQGESVDD